MKILVTGGSGYIGSITALRLIELGNEVTIIDNLSNSSDLSLRSHKLLERASFIKGDILDRAVLDNLFAKNEFDAVVHFAGLKAVGESVNDPLRYYKNNVSGTLNLLGVMKCYGVKTLIFSSSATVYGDPQSLPLTEDEPIKPTNPYGQSKAMVERILQDLCASDPEWRIASLRYFNPVGAHPSGMLGEDPLGTPNNLMPFIAQVAMARRDYLSVFGDDYATPDGTGIRDYIHVMDLAEGHLAALNYLLPYPTGTFLAVNRLFAFKGVADF